MIDKNGKIFKKVSIIDVLIILAVLDVAIGFVYRQTNQRLVQIFNADTPFYVTIHGEGLRHFIIDAVDIGDVVYRRHSRQPLGRVIQIDVEGAQDILLRSDGTASLVPSEGRYDIFITLESLGSITEVGFFVGGNDHIARGSEVELVSNRVFIPTATVYFVGEER